MERETIQEFGSLVAPSMSVSEVLGYVKLPDSSQYRVTTRSQGNIVVSGRVLRTLLCEDLAEAEVA